MKDNDEIIGKSEKQLMIICLMLKYYSLDLMPEKMAHQKVIMIF